MVSGPAVSTEIDGGAPVPVRPITSYGYDTFGEQVTTEDPNGNITTTNYDADGRQVAVTLAAVHAARCQHPDHRDHEQDLRRHRRGRVGHRRPGQHHVLRLRPARRRGHGDPAGRRHHPQHLSTPTASSSRSPTRSAPRARPPTTTWAGPVTSTQIVRQPSPAAYTTTSAYADAAGYLSSTTSPSGVTTSYGYDAAGEVTSAIDGAGDTTTYSYDALGRRTVTTMPDGTSQHTSFDEAGNVVGISSDNSCGHRAELRPRPATTPTATRSRPRTRRATPRPSATTRSACRSPRSSRSAPRSSITTSFGYDPAGNLTRYTDGNGNATTYTYNSWNLTESGDRPGDRRQPRPGQPDVHHRLRRRRPPGPADLARRGHGDRQLRRARRPDRPDRLGRGRADDGQDVRLQRGRRADLGQRSRRHRHVRLRRPRPAAVGDRAVRSILVRLQRRRPAGHADHGRRNLQLHLRQRRASGDADRRGDRRHADLRLQRRLRADLGRVRVHRRRVAGADLQQPARADRRHAHLAVRADGSLDQLRLQRQRRRDFQDHHRLRRRRVQHATPTTTPTG